MADIEQWGSFVVLPENRSAASKPCNRCRITRSCSTARRVSASPHLATELVKQLGSPRRCAPRPGSYLSAISRSPSPVSPDRDLVTCDVLVLEDVQLLADSNFNPFCGLLDRRLARKKPTIITCNVGPASLKHMPRRVTSRLAAGLVVQLEPLGPASRRLILEQLAKARKIRLDSEALDWLAEQATGGGVRPLLGFLEQLVSSRGVLKRAAVQQMLAAEPLASKPRRVADREAGRGGVRSHFQGTARPEPPATGDAAAAGGDVSGPGTQRALTAAARYRLRRPRPHDDPACLPQARSRRDPRCGPGRNGTPASCGIDVTALEGYDEYACVQ